jgi:hypothetical protein
VRKEEGRGRERGKGRGRERKRGREEGRKGGQGKRGHQRGKKTDPAAQAGPLRTPPAPRPHLWSLALLSLVLLQAIYTQTHTHTRSLFSRRGRTGAAGGARRSPGGRQPTGAADRLGRGAWSGPPCVGVCKDTGLLLLSYRPVTTQLHNQYILARHAHAQAAAPVRSRAPRACPPASAADARGLPACQRRTPVRPWRWQYFERAPARFPNRHTSPPAPPPPPLPCRQPPTRRA